MFTIVVGVPAPGLGIVLVVVDIEDAAGAARRLLGSLQNIPGVSASGGVRLPLVVVDDRMQAGSQSSWRTGVHGVVVAPRSAAPLAGQTRTREQDQE